MEATSYVALASVGGPGGLSTFLLELLKPRTLKEATGLVVRVLLQQPLQQPVKKEATEKLQALVLHEGITLSFFFIICFNL